MLRFRDWDSREQGFKIMSVERDLKGLGLGRTEEPLALEFSLSKRKVWWGLAVVVVVRGLK